mgnify:CR=1 FL=1
MSIITKGNRKRYFNTTTSVDINDTVNCEVSIELDKIIKDLEPHELAEILSGMEDGKAAVNEYFKLENQAEDLNGEALKRHLCDIVGIAYTSPVNNVIAQLIYKMNN